MLSLKCMIHRFFPSTLFAFGAILITISMMGGLLSCNKACQQGYENPNCSVEIRAQFENLYYTVTERKNQDTILKTYSATIIASPKSPFGLHLGNVANGLFVNTVVGTANADTLSLPYQSPDTNSYYIQGRGIISGNVMLLNYTVTYADSQSVVHADQYVSQWVHP